MRAWRGESDRLLSQETARLMLSAQIELAPEQFYGYSGQGLGAFLLKDGGNTYFSHPGHNDPGSNCMFIADPAAGRAAIVMTNGEQGLSLAMEILAAAVSEYGW